MADQRPLVQVPATGRKKQHVNADLLLVGAGIKLASGQTITYGTGNPEGVVTALSGSFFLREDGGTDTSIYRKESDTTNTGWVALTAAGGGGGSANGVLVTVNFGAGWSQKAQTVVTGQAWASDTKPLVGTVMVPTGTDPDELFLLDFKVIISDIVNGTGFTVTVYSEPEATGNYTVMVVGK
jgi:hypothetical protein